MLVTIVQVVSFSLPCKSRYDKLHRQATMQIKLLFELVATVGYLNIW